MHQFDACIYGRKMKKMMDNRLKPLRDKYNIKMIDIEILLYFYEYKDRSASDLYRELGLNKGQVSTGIDNLCKQGMLAAYTNPEDRRYQWYELLEKGKLVTSEVMIEINKVILTVTKGISSEEQGEFCRVGKAICDNIDKYCKE